MWKLCTIGEALIDFIPAEKGRRLKDVSSFKRVAGGAPANVAIAFCRLSGRAKMISKLGEDAFGDYILDVLSKTGVDVSTIRQTDEADTSLAFVSLSQDGNRDFMFYRRNCADLLLAPEEVDEDVLDDCQLLHFCSVSLKESPMKQTHVKLLEAAEKRKMIISFDPNLRLSLWNDDEGLRKTVLEFLPYAHIIKISDEELFFIIGKNSIEEALPIFFSCKNTQMVIYTKGCHGAEIYTRTCSVKHEGFQVDSVDTTGAGDAFVAAFLYMIAKEEKALASLDEKALQKMNIFSNAYGALTTLKSGALDSYASLEETLQFLNTVQKRM